MRTDISKPLDTIDDQIPLLGTIRVRHFRADGRGDFKLIQEKELKNVVTYHGLNRIANRAAQATATTPFYVIGIGTQSAVHSLGSVQGGVGEVQRKTSNFTGANAQSCEWIFCQATWGGASDSVQSIDLETVFLADFASSYANASSNCLGAIANGLGVTLAGSDLLDLTYRIRIGSHNLGHSTGY